MASELVYLCIGGNIGEKLANLEETRMFVSFNIGDIEAESGIYESEAWGMEGAPSFLNQVLLVRTSLPVDELMQEIAELEDFYGRERSPDKYLNREMDVDVLFYGSGVIEQEHVTIPHPRLHLRRFVLAPLAELAPEMKHPVLGKTVAELLASCPDESTVTRL